ncbi:MAG: efflux RND transporter periplasmic adaptor subunit [Cyclobacteriaceae bacterium]
MKKVIPTLIGVGLVLAVIYVLFLNKKEMDASTRLSLAEVEIRPVRAIRITSQTEGFIHTYPGQLVAAAELILTSSTQGQVAQVGVKKGQSVNAGDFIAAVNNDLLREQVNVAKSAYDKLDRDMERYSVMLENDAITAQQFESLELNFEAAKAKYLAAKKQLDDSSIESPVSGTINKVFIEQGSMLGPGVPVCEIVSAENLLCRLRLTRNEAARVADASSILVIINEEDSLQAKIASESVKPDYSGLYETDLVLEGDLRNYDPGMTATAIMKIIPPPDEVFVPQNALLGFGSTQLYVYCADGGKAVRKNVIASENINGWVKISKGLEAGDSVITDGNTIISQGDKISIRP